MNDNTIQQTSFELLSSDPDLIVGSVAEPEETLVAIEKSLAVSDHSRDSSRYGRDYFRAQRTHSKARARVRRRWFSIAIPVVLLVVFVVSQKGNGSYHRLRAFLTGQKAAPVAGAYRPAGSRSGMPGITTSSSFDTTGSTSDTSELSPQMQASAAMFSQAVDMLLSGGNVTVAHTPKDPKVARDLEGYLERDMKAIAPLDRQVKSSILSVASVSPNRPQGQAAIATMLQTRGIPAYKRLLEGAEKIRPATLPVQQVHMVYLQATRMKLLTLQHMLQGQESAPGSWEYGVESEEQAANAYATLFDKLVRALAKDQDVDVHWSGATAHLNLPIPRTVPPTIL